SCEPLLHLETKALPGQNLRTEKHNQVAWLALTLHRIPESRGLGSFLDNQNCSDARYRHKASLYHRRREPLDPRVGGFRIDCRTAREGDSWYDIADNETSTFG